nr:UbiA family prenyltransferase [Geodermatophilaceae bacterium]
MTARAASPSPPPSPSPAPALSLGALLACCHPGPTVAVTAVAAMLARAAGGSWGPVLLVTAAVLTGQLCIGWVNDWLDRDRDAHAGRRDKPLAAGRVRADTVWWAAVIAGAACVVLSLATGLIPGVLHLFAVASGLAYDLGIKGTALSPVPFALSFGLLPAFVVAALPGSGSAPVWMVAAGALLGTGAHFANVLPDLEHDVATGVRGLGHRIGRTVCVGSAAVLLLAAVATLALGPAGPPTVAGWGAVALSVPVGTVGLVQGRRPGSRAPF